MANGYRGSTVLLIIISCLIGCQKVSPVAKQKSVQTNEAKVAAEEKSMVTDPLDLPVLSRVDGKYLKAFSVAYASFKEDGLIPESKRKIENYQIEFREQADHYFVLFLAKRKATETGLLGGESELGKDVIYTLDRNNFTITDQKFYK